jgi:pimeloyl-ACP methyl ester carboxylesterase
VYDDVGGLRYCWRARDQARAAPQDGTSHPTSGGAAQYLEHVEKELLPFIDTKFRTSGRILAGWSLGGLFTFYTFLERPGLFSAYIAISPSLWWNSMEPLGWAGERIPDGARFEQRLVITQGSLEGGNIGSSVKNGIVPLLKERNARDWEYVEIPGVSHNYVPYKALYEGLRASYPDFAVPQAVLSEGLSAIKNHYASLSASYGYDLDVPDSVYAALVITWLNSHTAEEVLPLTSEWTTVYPHSAVGWYYHGRMHQLLDDPDKARQYFEKALQLEQSKVLPDSEWLNPIESRLEELAEPESQ